MSPPKLSLTHLSPSHSQSLSPGTPVPGINAPSRAEHNQTPKPDTTPSHTRWHSKQDTIRSTRPA